MAVPTITAITPSSGPAMGLNFVTISGTNFRMPSEEDLGLPWGDETEIIPTVRVTFGGYEGTNISVWSSGELDVTVPGYMGDADLAAFPPVDVTLTNLDDDGVPIPGESVTLALAYTYKREPLRRPSLDTDTPIARILREIIRVIKRQFVANSGMQTHVDFSPDGIFYAFAKTPSLFIANPVLLPDAYGYENPLLEIVEEDGSVTIHPAATMHTLSMNLVGQSDSEMEFLALMQEARKLTRGNPYLVVNADVPVGEQLRLPFAMPSEPAASGLAGANIYSFISTVEVRRIPIVYLPAKGRTWPVTEEEILLYAA